MSFKAKTMRTFSIRTHLLLLVLAMSVPLVVGVGLSIYSDMAQTIAHTKTSLRMLAYSMVSNTGGRIDYARQTMQRLAARPLVRLVDPEHCDPALGELHSLTPGYTNVVYTSVDGLVVCSALPQPGGKLAYVGGRLSFQKLIKERRFNVGEPIFGKITGKWITVLSEPIWNERQEMVGALQLPIDLKALDPNIPEHLLPPGSHYGFVSSDGVVIWRNHDTEGVIGTRPASSSAKKVVEVRDGAFEGRSTDGVNRYFAVVPMAEMGWIAYVGVPVAEVYAAAQQRAINAATIALAAIALLLVLATAIARRIARPVVELASVARAVHGGDLGVRAVLGGPREIAAVAADFNAMIAAQHRDMTARKLAEDEIRHLAFEDPLTHLPNRRLLLDRLQQALASSARSNRLGALLLIDLDNFKTLNDTLGHDKGDLLLQQVGQRLAGCSREGDTVARLGGDEFVVLLEDLSETAEEAATQSEAAGEKILAALRLPYLLAGYENRSTPSIGVTLFSGHQNSIEDLLKQADLAMYQAKTAGRNMLRFFDPEMQAIVAERAALEVDLREAVRQQQFIVYYQPQVDGKGGLNGAEALVRWQHPRRGLVPPLEFIALAEETGLILPLGHWVLETACRQLALWAPQPAMAELSLAVNISARQLQQPDFVAQVQAVLASTGARPQRLKLELTESLLVHDVEGVVAKMSALKEHGVGFSLDDFGTGYSSLSALKRLPLEQLKIDQSFVRDILVDANDAAIARMVIVLAESMGLAVLAEGVETAAQQDFLASQGCHAYQGYLFSRPLPIEEFEEFVIRV